VVDESCDFSDFGFWQFVKNVAKCPKPEELKSVNPLTTLKSQYFKPLVEAVTASTDGIIATII